MKKIIIISIMLSFFSIFVFSGEYDPVLAAMQKNFARGSLSTKIQVLQDSDDYPDVDMDALYGQALQFILDNSVNLDSDVVARELTILAVRLSGLNGYNESSSVMWKLFNIYEDEQVRIEILSALSSLAPDPWVIDNLNNWLKQQNDKFNSNKHVSTKVISEAVVTLGLLGDSSSFPVVFSVSSTNFSEDITYKANQALKKLNGSYSLSLEKVIQSSSPKDKNLAFKLAVADDEMQIEEKGNLFKIALDIGLHAENDNAEGQEQLQELRSSAIRQLSLLKWADASDLIIEHFNKIINEYESGESLKSSVLETIICLGSVGTHEAAERLTQYLGSMNTNLENGQTIDSDISLAVINSIGLIGDNVAFDDLLYSGYLDYPDTVKKAAREALNNLKTR